MKKISATLVFAVLTLVTSHNGYSQVSQSGINQVELMKQFIGTWRYDTNKDTVYTADFKPYGKGGLEFTLRGTARDKVWLEMKQLWGYDRKNDKVVVAGLMKDSPFIMLQSAWFTDKSNLKQIPLENAADPEKAGFIVLFEIKSPDLVVREEIINGKSLGTEKYVRVKD